MGVTGHQPYLADRKMASTTDFKEELEATDQKANRHDDLGALAEAATMLQQPMTELQKDIAKQGFGTVPVEALSGLLGGTPAEASSAVEPPTRQAQALKENIVAAVAEANTAAPDKADPAATPNGGAHQTELAVETSKLAAESPGPGSSAACARTRPNSR